MDIEKYKANFFITEQDVANVQTIGLAIDAYLPQLLDDFYEWLKQRPEYDNHFCTPQHLQRVKSLQLEHWRLFFSANLDQDYLRRRQKIGETHWHTGLNLESYYAGVTTFNKLFYSLFKAQNITDFDLVNSFQKLVSMDTALTSDTYNRLVAEAMQAQNQALKSLSTPIAQLWEGVLLLPLVGIIDSTRAQQILQTVLNTVSSQQASVFILDIGGVGVVDTAVANHLIKITKATKLMGCTSILSGISPAIANTLVELGVELSELQTTANMRDALQKAFVAVGIELKVNKQAAR